MFRFGLAFVSIMFIAALTFGVIDAWRISPARGVFTLIAALMMVVALGYLVSFSWPLLSLF